jgi:protein SCO1/2
MNLRKLAVFSMVILLAGCSRAKHYELKGQVLAVNREKQELLVKHEEIPGYMMAMTMPYRVQSGTMLDNLSAGDLITAQLEVKHNVGTITEITRTGNAPPDLPKPSPLAEGIVMMLKEGDQVPNPVFIDEDGKSRPLDEIRDARATVLTFMYTKCPMPTFCPMMDRNFVQVQKELKTKPDLLAKTRLLSVSFDPRNDTPPVLKKHARELGADPALWRFVSAEQDAVDKFAMSFGVTLVRGQSPNPDEIGHTLRTAIVDRNGKLVKTYTGNEWTPAQVVSDLEKLP